MLKTLNTKSVEPRKGIFEIGYSRKEHVDRAEPVSKHEFGSNEVSSNEVGGNEVVAIRLMMRLKRIKKRLSPKNCLSPNRW